MDKWLKIGTVNICLLLVTIIVPSLCFLVGVPVQRWQFPLCVFLTFILYYMVFGEKKWQGSVFVIQFAIMVVAVVASLLIFDISWDGNTCRKYSFSGGKPYDRCVVESGRMGNHV